MLRKYIELSHSSIGRDVIVGQTVTVQRIEQRDPANDRDELGALIRTLAGAVLRQESATLAQLLNDSGMTSPADLRIREISQSGHVVDRTSEGSLAGIIDYFCHLDQRRLLITGDPGSGKSIFAMRLAQDIANGLVGARRSTSIGDQPPRIPVRLSAPEFTPSANFARFAEMHPQHLSARFDDWLAQYVSDLFGIPTQVSASLVDEGYLLPIIDGIDEMDAGNSTPWRAIALLGALNCVTSHGMRSVVVTCRTDAFRQMLTYVETHDYRHLLQDGKVVSVMSIAPDEAVRYLASRFPDPSDHDGIQLRWKPIVTQLKDVSSKPTQIAVALTNPLRLFLATEAYSSHARDPMQMLNCSTRTELDSLLFAKFVPAVIRRQASRESVYEIDEVLRWFRTLAGYLARDEGAGRSRSDIRIDQIWRLRERTTKVIAAVVLGGLSTIIFLLGVLSDLLYAIYNDGYATILLAVVGFIVQAAVFHGATRDWSQIQRFELIEPLKDPAERKRILIRIARYGAYAAITGVAAYIYSRDPRNSISVALGVFIACILSGLVTFLTVHPLSMQAPRRFLRQGILHLVVFFLYGFTVAVGLVAAEPFIARFGGPYSLGLATWIGYTFGLLMICESSWLRYFSLCAIEGPRGRLPFRLAAFLDWSCSTGLMRVSGVSVQFRHKEFQEWLAADTGAPASRE